MPFFWRARHVRVLGGESPRSTIFPDARIHMRYMFVKYRFECGLLILHANVLILHLNEINHKV